MDDYERMKEYQRYYELGKSMRWAVTMFIVIILIVISWISVTDSGGFEQIFFNMSHSLEQKCEMVKQQPIYESNFVYGSDFIHKGFTYENLKNRQIGIIYDYQYNNYDVASKKFLTDANNYNLYVLQMEKEYQIKQEIRKELTQQS